MATTALLKKRKLTYPAKETEDEVVGDVSKDYNFMSRIAKAWVRDKYGRFKQRPAKRAS